MIRMVALVALVIGGSFMSTYYPACRAALSVVFDGFGGDDSNPTIIHTIPRSATAHLTGYKEADTFELEFDAHALPLSPELVRAMAVELYMFQTDGLDESPEGYASDENLVVTGLVDMASLHYSSSNRSFRVDGRDYTALLLDKPWPQQKRIPVGRPIDTIVQELVDEATHRATIGRTLEVIFEAGGDAPNLGNVATTTEHGKLTITKKGKIKTPFVGDGHSHTSKKGIPVKASNSYWDVIYRLCVRHGLIVFVRNNQVVISTPQTLTENAVGRVHKLVYGQHLAELDVERHLGKEVVPQIVVTSYDAEAGATVQAAFPEHPPSRPTGVGTVKDEIRYVTVAGVKSVTRLREIAETYYKNIGRAEAKQRFSTKDLRDLEGSDVLRFRPGDAVAIGLGTFNRAEMRQLSAPARRLRLRELGYSETVAQLIAENFEKIKQFEQPFYLRELGLSWSIDQGISIDGEMVNFVAVARDDVAR